MKLQDRKSQRTSLAYKPWTTLLAVTLVMASGGFIRGSVAYAASQNPQPDQRSARPHGTARPEFTGSDGSQTGIASFQGNFTTIQAPPGQALALYRLANCSLTLAEGTYYIDSGAYTQTLSTPNYERVLHEEAQLTTTPDVFASGCIMQPNAGTDSAPGVFVGTTTTGVNVFAAIGLTGSGSNGLYVLAGTTTFKLNSFALATANVLTPGDLNGDGNRDLVITSNGIDNKGGLRLRSAGQRGRNIPDRYHLSDCRRLNRRRRYR